MSAIEGNRWGWGAMSDDAVQHSRHAQLHTGTVGSCRDSCGGCGRDDSIFSNVSSYHPGGCNVMFADGSCRFIKDSISPQTWMSLGTKDQGDIVTADSY